jgi:hypothetical protein
MIRRIVDVAVIIPDASPVLTLARIGRLDLFEFFSAPIQIVDQFHYEITKTANDRGGTVAAWFQRMGNRITIVETLVGLGVSDKNGPGRNAARRQSRRDRGGRVRDVSWRARRRRISCRWCCLKTRTCCKRALPACPACIY